MLLSVYEALTQQLFQAATSPVPLISAAVMTNYINLARAQVAAEGECIVIYPATLAVVAPTQNYTFSTIVPPVPLPVSAPSGIGQVLNVRQVSFQIADAQKQVFPRSWPWFKMYLLDQPIPVPAQPREWAQFGQGVNGTLWINLPDTNYTLNLDCVCLPIDLVDDLTVDAIPRLWDQAVPFWAAWLAMQNAQRQADTDFFMARYKEMMARARSAATPSQLPGIYSQGPDPAMQNRYGLAAQRGGQSAG